MKNLIFFCIIYLFSANRIEISEKHVTLHKGRLLPIEEGYNEKIENIRFLKELDSVDVLLDDFERDLLDTRKKAFKQIDELTGKMTNEHNIHTLSKFIKRKVSQDNFKEVIKKAMEEKDAKLKELNAVKVKLQNRLNQKLKREQKSLDLKNVDPEKIEQITDLLERLKNQKKSFNLKIDFQDDENDKKVERKLMKDQEKKDNKINKKEIGKEKISKIENKIQNKI